MKIAILALAVLSLALTPIKSMAYDAGYTEKLERRVMALEQKIFSASNIAGEKLVPQVNSSLADFEVRIQQLEEEAQQVYGAVEELGYAVDKFAKKMELISKDFDLRLQDIEKAIASGKISKKLRPKAPKAKKSKAVKAKKATNDMVVPEKISPTDHYNKAYGFLVAAAYPKAEKWLKEFLRRHGNHELADNAYYWLGETYLVQNKIEPAVVSFSTGLSKFPQGAKASANLLKMGVAFKRMGKEDFARSAWEKLVHDYSNSPEVAKAKKELKKLAPQSKKPESKPQTNPMPSEKI